MFSIVSPQDHEVLSLYASDGPCNDAELSTLNLEIEFLPCNCPIGFQPSEMNAGINCTCECHESIGRYMTCDPIRESLMKQSQSIVWISYINYTNALTAGTHCCFLCPSRARQGAWKAAMVSK